MSEKGTEKDRVRGTGGNRFIGPDATRADLLRSINDQLGDIHEYAVQTGRTLDIAEITISTQRIPSGRISVNVSADLGTTTPGPCHCGAPVVFGFDGDPAHHRGMCGHCDAVRCDAYPGACFTPFDGGRA